MPKIRDFILFARDERREDREFNGSIFLTSGQGDNLAAFRLCDIEDRDNELEMPFLIVACNTLDLNPDKFMHWWQEARIPELEIGSGDQVIEDPAPRRLAAAVDGEAEEAAP